MYIGKITNYYTKLGVAEVKIETHDLSVGDEIKILGETTGVYESHIDEIRLNLEPVKMVLKGDTCSIKTSELVRRGDKMYKMISTAIS